MDGPFYDALETRDPAEREAALMAALPRDHRHGEAARRRLPRAARQGPPGGHHRPPRPGRPAGDPQIRADRPAARHPPFGGFAAVPLAAVARVFASPGPIYELEARRPDFFRMARALYAAGIRAGDLVHNTFLLSPDPGRGDGRERRRWRSAAR